ncbi:MAG: hypothetical protein CVV35_00510 [Methanomicrobiales archaeon HGW-Methanomicrobiales-6]|nr:MAG: hypothetical protein CVV35_00510 [Methanomicrobiales archaeon HGW-Methanomicrobiales-6]
MLEDSGAEMLLNYLPVGLEKAAQFYADCAMEARLLLFGEHEPVLFPMPLHVPGKTVQNPSHRTVTPVFRTPGQESRGAVRREKMASETSFRTFLALISNAAATSMSDGR